MECPLCHSKSKLAFHAKGHAILDCEICSHRYAGIEVNEKHVEKIYDNSYFTGGGAGYTNYLFESEMLRKRGQSYAKKIAAYSNGKGKVLDVGAAAGCILQGFVDEGWKGTGLEPNKAIADYGREKFGLDIRQNTLEDFLPDEKYELISMIQVVAHFYNPKEAFANAYNLLDKNGFLLIETWNRNSLSAKVFGKTWHEYAPPSVLHWFSIDGLTDFLRGLGFEKIVHARPSKKISGKHAKSLLKYRLGNFIPLGFIPDKMFIPYPSEDLFWALYHKK